MKVGMISLGCAKNLVDSEMVLGLVDEAGMEIVTNPKEADIIMINTCGFIESAKKEAIDTILEMVDYKDEHKKLVVMGCLAERYIKELKEDLPEVDRFITLKEYPHIGKILKELTGDKLTFGETLQPFNRILATPKHMAYVRIADGCDNRCAYCAIPLIRGNFRSRKMDSIMEETKNLVKNGVKEIVLISQDTTRYGSDLKDGSSLATLLQELSTIEGIEFLRFLYLYPDEVTDELIETVSTNPNIVPYFDIPVQHASNSILKAMKRRGSIEAIQTLFQKIQNRIPQAIFRTTLIVGFPGETEADFEELKSFVASIRFHHLGAFMYSNEEDTPAYLYPNQIDEDTKNRRYRELMKLQQKISYQRNKEQIGTIQKVIVEGYDRALKMYKTRSYVFAPDEIDGWLFVKSEQPLTIGEIIHVQVTDAVVYGLSGVVKS